MKSQTELRPLTSLSAVPNRLLTSAGSRFFSALWLTGLRQPDSGHNISQTETTFLMPAPRFGALNSIMINYDQ